MPHFPYLQEGFVFCFIMYNRFSCVLSSSSVYVFGRFNTFVKRYSDPSSVVENETLFQRSHILVWVLFIFMLSHLNLVSCNNLIPFLNSCTMVPCSKAWFNMLDMHSGETRSTAVLRHVPMTCRNLPHSSSSLPCLMLTSGPSDFGGKPSCLCSLYMPQIFHIHCQCARLGHLSALWILLFAVVCGLGHLVLRRYSIFAHEQDCLVCLSYVSILFLVECSQGESCPRDWLNGLSSGINF